MKIALKQEIFQHISDSLETMGLEGYVIGGFVRDILLNRPSKDIDVVVVGSGIEVAKHVHGKLKIKGKVTVFKNFGTAMFKYGGCEIEFVGARKESYNRDSRKPVVENGSLKDDQDRRDFTINAMAICLNKNRLGEVIDPFNGLADLKSRVIKTPLEPNTTFSDDPLRMLRAVRFATQLNFKINKHTLQAIQNNAERLNIISVERIADEFNKILLTEKPSFGILLLEQCGLLDKFLPELVDMKGVEVVKDVHHKDNFIHTAQVVDNISKKTNKLWLRWSALLHDIGKPPTKKFVEGTGWTFHGHDFVGSKMVYTIFKRLKLPLGEPCKYVSKLVKLHLRPIGLAQEIVTDSAIRRLLFDAGNDIDDLMLLCEADITSKNINKVKRFLSNFKTVRKKLIEIEEKDRLRNFQPPVKGEEIMEYFNLKPCKEVGILKNAIKEAILEGDINNDHKEAFDFMIKKGIDLGLNVRK